MGELCALVDGQLAVPPFAGGGVELQRIVMLGGRRVSLIDGDCRPAHGGLRIADLGILVTLLGSAFPAFLHVRERQGVRPRAVEPGRGSLLGIVDGDLAGGFARRLQGLGDHHGDDLAGVPDTV